MVALKRTWQPGIAFVFLFLSFALVALTGCSSSHTLRVDASQPVYFGVAPLSMLPLDSTHTHFVKNVRLATAHVSEKASIVQGESASIEKEASDNVIGDVGLQVAQALGPDTVAFIGNAKIRADIEAYIPVSTYVVGFLGSLFIKDATTEAGEASSETIEILGNVYSVRRAAR